MKIFNWRVTLGITLLALSTIGYLVHYLIFKDAHHIFIYLVGDIAFVFVEVLLVTLIIHSLLDEREKKTRMRKMNMVIGAFFSEAGIKLLDIISKYDPAIDEVTKLSEKQGTPEDKFAELNRCLKKHDYEIRQEKMNLEELRSFLISKRRFFLRLLENPMLLEHEVFSHLLWAVFHLTEELEARKTLDDLPAIDREHLTLDTRRVYGQLAVQWLHYMRHLKTDFPFLFSLSMRTSPFDNNACPVIKK
jgi:hypothetical protein